MDKYTRESDYLYPAVHAVDIYLLITFPCMIFPGFMFASYYFFNGSF